MHMESGMFSYSCVKLASCVCFKLTQMTGVGFLFLFHAVTLAKLRLQLALVA